VTEELLTTYQHVIDRVDLITSSGGAFEVKVNDDLIFSKKTMQKRHAEPGEILGMFRAIVGPDVPTYPQNS
jgi:predicted Rdx family selenoprotein